MKAKMCINGKMQEIEIAELDVSQSEIPAPEPTPEERLAELEEALDLLLSGVME